MSRCLKCAKCKCKDCGDGSTPELKTAPVLARTSGGAITSAGPIRLGPGNHPRPGQWVVIPDGSPVAAGHTSQHRAVGRKRQPDPLWIPPKSIWSPQLPRSMADEAFIPETVWEQVEPLPAKKVPRHKGANEAPGPRGTSMHNIVDDLGNDHGGMSAWQTVDHSERVCRNRNQLFAYSEDRDLTPAIVKAIGQPIPETPWAPWNLYGMKYPRFSGRITKVLEVFNYAQLLQNLDDQLEYETGLNTQKISTQTSTPVFEARLVEVTLEDTDGPYRIELKKSVVDISGDQGVEDKWLVYRLIKSRYSQDQGWQEIAPIDGWGQPVTKAGALEDRAGLTAAIYPLGRLGSDQSQYPDNIVITGPLVAIVSGQGLATGQEIGKLVVTGISTPAQIEQHAVNALGLPDEPPPLPPQPQLIYRNLTAFTTPDPYAVIGDRTVDLGGNMGWEALEGPDGETAMLLWLDEEYNLHLETTAGGHKLTPDDLLALTGSDQTIIELTGTPAFHTPARRVYLKRFDDSISVLAAWHPWRDAPTKAWSELKLKRPKNWPDWIKYRNSGEPTPKPKGLPLVLADLIPAGGG